MPNPILLENMEWIARQLEANTERELKIAEDYYENEKKKLKIKKYGDQGQNR